MEKTGKRVEVDMDARRVPGVIVSERLSDTGLMKISLDGGPTVVRHKNRVRPLDEEARAFLGQNHRDDDATH
jgi:hypothetical protein